MLVALLGSAPGRAFRMELHDVPSLAEVLPDGFAFAGEGTYDCTHLSCAWYNLASVVTGYATGIALEKHDHIPWERHVWKTPV